MPRVLEQCPRHLSASRPGIDLAPVQRKTPAVVPLVDLTNCGRRMSIPHQVITGALNRGENVYATGSVEGATFVVCAVGTDVVILAADFSRVQIIPGASRNAEQLISSISCCQDSGKIAATYGNVIKVFEPVSAVHEKHSSVLNYQWVETQSFTVKEQVHSVLWNMDGLRMTVVIGKELFLYQHRSLSCVQRSNFSTPVMFSIAEEEQSHDSCAWDIVWSVQLAQRPKYIKFSPDGAFLAISGENDYLVKIFYQDSFDDTREHLSFGFFVLHHPAPVRGFEWRRTGRYMPRKCIQAALITWCEDNTSRVWKETPSHELAIIDLSGDGGEPLMERNKPRKLFGKHLGVKKARNKILNKLKGMVSERKRHNEEQPHALGLKAQIGKSPSFSDLQSGHHSYNNVQFHLTATINAETDCMLVPSMENGGVLQKPLCVHWLNNKELVFSVGAEKLLAEILQQSERSATMSPCENVDAEDKENNISLTTNDHSERGEWANTAMESVCSETPSSKDILDVKLETLLRQWSRSSDVLFTIHPVDGSLLTWTIEWLDDLQRQPVVSFTSRFPSAFPVTDASSLHPTLNTFNPFEPIYVDTYRKEEGKVPEGLLNERLLERRTSNTIHLLTNHENGSLNLWHMAVDEDSGFTTILNITHMSRMCGHRFQINQIIAHPFLPLLLTTSRFQSEEIMESEDERALSEVILWKISPVGPLCKSGGVKELARVASPLRTGFDYLGWIPVILPSCTLGTVCNSPSSCFIASNGCDLVIYQAVVDARGFIAEIYSSTRRNVEENADWSSSEKSAEKRPNVGLLQRFNVVSTQSTAKPGCVLEVGKIVDVLKPDSEVLLLHVFPEQVLVSTEDMQGEGQSHVDVTKNRSETEGFNDHFFVVVVEREDNVDYFVMYSLLISSQRNCGSLSFDGESLRSKDQSRWDSTNTPHFCQLMFTTKKVCKQRIPLPSDVRILSAAPAAGHLPSSSLYPACQAPYLMITSCDDETVRFWQCFEYCSGSDRRYEWHEWHMVCDNRPSELEVDGPVLSVSAAHSGRIACAYDPKSGYSTEQNVEVGVFECESTGGIGWMREDTFVLKNVKMSNSFFSDTLNTPAETGRPLRSSALSQSPSLNSITKDMVRLDWVSTEDGSHILTVGVGSQIFMYNQVSLDPAQQNVTLMKDSETTLRRPSLQKRSSLVAQSHSQSHLIRWVCTRVLELYSADGLPPIPTTLSWARDGLLIVGMQSEMRVYNQWNMKQMNFPGKTEQQDHNAHVLSLAISQSHLMLDQLQRRKDLPPNRTRLFTDLVNKTTTNKEARSSSVLDVISAEGLFEAARLSSPILPQYHPKQLIVLLNAGRTKRVKAILLHVLISLKQRQVSSHNPLSRAASMKRMSTVDAMEDAVGGGVEKPSIAFDEDSPDYNEIDDIAPLPLYSLLAADTDCSSQEYGEKAESFGKSGVDEYDSLFSSDKMDDEELDEMLREDDEASGGRSRQPSVTSDRGRNPAVPSIFTARHNRMLTELLTHTHLPGLSSVDQMHLLAIADTLSHFSADVVDKVTQANAGFQPTAPTAIGNFSAGGYATVASGIEAVDECGLRFLMAVKQHEYLLLCLPIKQRMELKKNGLSSADIIWAQHSETEMELLNAIPSLQKSNSTWEELRNLGVAWWLKNTASLKICMEKIAKAAFQQNQDPMDSSLYYLALKKKNILTHLFKTVRDQQMADFFTQDFNTEHWKKVAAKNAFVLMSKQRFHHAAAFFLLSGSVKDALQTILRKCRDLQLAMVVLRLYESDTDLQQAMLKEILCREVLGQSPEDFEQGRGVAEHDSMLGPGMSRDPFVRSMAYWLLKDYSRAATTLVQEAQWDDVSPRTSLSDIFNFYSFLRKHPLVVRQRIADAGAKVGSTEQFLAVAKRLETLVTPPERRLYFRTAAVHMAHGCPMLALDVLSRLPKSTSIMKDDPLKDLLAESSYANTGGSTDVIAQHLKFVASLRIFTDELSTLASGFEVDGGQLRQQLLIWLEKEVEVLKQSCDYRPSCDNTSVFTDEDTEAIARSKHGHQSANQTVNPSDIVAQKPIATRWQWLFANQKLLRSFTSFCALHCAQNHRLTSALMELLLLLFEVQKDSKMLNETDGDTNWFPLLIASASSAKMFVSSPLSFIENQCYDLLISITDMTAVPDMDNHLQKAYKLYNLSQGLSSSLYQSLCGSGSFASAVSSSALLPSASTRRSRTVSGGSQVTTLPSRWPGVDDLVALLSRDKDFDAPRLRQLLAECFVAVSMSLFCFAFAVYDSRWLYRLAAHKMDVPNFSFVFGGGGETRSKSTPPVRPPNPRTRSPGSVSSSTDAQALRSKFNSKVLGPDVPSSVVPPPSPQIPETKATKWVPPQKNIVQFFADKPSVNCKDDYGVEYDSDGDLEGSIASDEEEDRCENANPKSFAWEIIRLALIEQQIFKIRQFLALVGFNPDDVPAIAPRVESILRLLDGWSVQLQQRLQAFRGNAVVDLLPNMNVDVADQPFTSRKYTLMTEKNNTPFESEDPRAAPLKRLWAYLINQEHLQPIFVRHIFAAKGQQELPFDRSDTLADIENQSLPDAFKIIQKDHEPIVAFGCNQEKPGWLVVSTGRELQEMDISSIFEDSKNSSSWLYNRAELDVSLLTSRGDPSKDCDDYQLFTESTTQVVQPPKTASMIFKRTVNGIRRIDSHPTASLYVTGSSDGSIRVWEWGVGQPVYTARVAGQHAKVSKISFSCNGNKFAAVDGDGMLCLWQATPSADHRKPFFSHRCHNKAASDVRFLGPSSSVLVTAGASSGEFNLSLWDTLLPQNRALVHSWTIVSGGRHGELCLWDIRQRQLRTTVKAFDWHQTVKTLVTDYAQDLIVAGSSDGDIKIWSADLNPQLMYSLPGEHAAKSGFSFRQVAQSSVQGVQQLFIDQQLRLFSCECCFRRSGKFLVDVGRKGVLSDAVA
ncbi:hypothetical protein Q1695_001621 [Nippostrongylus brasiliensis]|nr:hypothetical protein Q1695_001621 [Nippostrongylus brasiliensis]